MKTQEDKARAIYGIVRVAKTVIGVPIQHLSEVCHVDEITPLPVDSSLLIGGFHLRESIVPVLDFQRLCGQPRVDDAPRLMIVICFDQKFLAFSIDEVLGIATHAGGELQSLRGKEPGTNTCYEGIFTQDDNFISVLDIKALFALPGVYAVTRPQITDANQHQTKREPMLVFEAGGALFSIPAVEVYAAVPRQEIKQTAITSGPCLGEISYYNRRIPVLSPVDILDVGAPGKSAQSQIVVLNFDSDTLFGFAVDAVRTIESFSDKDRGKAPVCLQNKGLINGVIVKDDERQIFELDTEALRSNETVATLATFSEQPKEDTARDQQAAANKRKKDVVHAREKFLVVKAGGTLAIPLEEITYILGPPENVTPAPDHTPGFCGYFSRFGQSVALFDLCAIMGRTQGERETGRVLLTGEKEGQIGYWVEQVVGIELSEWREAIDEKTHAKGVVKLSGGDTETVLPLLNLESVATVPV